MVKNSEAMTKKIQDKRYRSHDIVQGFLEFNIIKAKIQEGELISYIPMANDWRTSDTFKQRRYIQLYWSFNNIRSEAIPKKEGGILQ